MNRRFQKLLSEALFTEVPGAFAAEHVWQPPTDVFECEQAYVLRMEIGGVARKDFTIELTDDILTVSGCRLEPTKYSKVALRRLEISYGAFKRSVCLPGPVEGDRIEAGYENGFLEVVLPKSAPKSLSIDVEGDE